MPNITVYLPDQLAERAKAAGLPMSHVFQVAVTEAVQHAEELAASQDGMTSLEHELTDRDGERILLRFRGEVLDASGSVSVYRTAEGKVIVTFDDSEWTEFADIADFDVWLNNETRNNLGGASEAALREAAVKLGLPRVVEL